MTTENATATGPDLPINAMFHRLDPDYAQAVVKRALEFRGKAPKSLRDSFNYAIRNNVKVDGFQNADRASPNQLKIPALVGIIEGADKLAGAVLKTWVESHPQLRGAVAERLEGAGIPAGCPGFKEGSFDSLWEWADYTAHLAAILEADDSLNVNDVHLMLCCLSGRVPDSREPSPPSSSLLDGFLQQMDALPPDAPDWDDVEGFVHALAKIAVTKEADRAGVQTEALKDAISKAAGEFRDDLLYLDVSLDSWLDDATSRGGVIPEALAVANRLGDLLEEYRLLRPQAPSRAEEVARAPQRSEKEDGILAAVESWRGLIADYDAAQEKATAAAEAASQEAGGDLPQPLDGTEDSPAGAGGLEAGPAPEDQVVPAEDYRALESRNQELERQNSGLQDDKEFLDAENSEFRSEISRLQQMEEYWRDMYVAAKAAGGQDDESQTPTFASVNEAIDHAKKTYPDELLFALNSKSDKDNPFRNPQEVFDALAWLATEYRSHRVNPNPGSAPDFKSGIKEACPGWSYKSGQTKVTREQFLEWYTTPVEDKLYNLDHHVGKGVRGNPQYNIRIAFAWDDERQKVLIGYLGPHQKTRQT